MTLKLCPCIAAAFLASALLSGAAQAQSEPASSAAPAAAPAKRKLPPMPETEAPKWNIKENGKTRQVAWRAWTLFRAAWEKGEWQPFLDMTTDDFQFYFPQGEFAGLHEGRTGKEKLVAWANYHRSAGNRLRSAATHVTVAGNVAVIEATAESLPPGFYRNYEAIIFEVSGDRISALREYWNVLDPGADPSGN